jgi:hypothetical protein
MSSHDLFPLDSFLLLLTHVLFTRVIFNFHTLSLTLPGPCRLYYDNEKFRGRVRDDVIRANIDR